MIKFELNEMVSKWSNFGEQTAGGRTVGRRTAGGRQQSNILPMVYTDPLCYRVPPVRFQLLHSSPFH